MAAISDIDRALDDIVDEKKATAGPSKASDRKSEAEFKKKAAAAVSNSRVYVGNMSWEATADDVRDFMGKAGTVVEVDLLRRRDGKSLGAAIVTYSSKDEAVRAVKEVHDQEHMGRPVMVREDREAPGGRAPRDRDTPRDRAPRDRAPREDRRDERGPPRGGARGSGHRVYFGNLSWDVKWQELKDFAREAGPVGYAKVEEMPGGRSKGFGICEYETRADADKAVRMLNERNLMGRNVFVKHDGEPTRPRGGDRDGPRGGYDRGADRGGFDRRGGGGGYDRGADRGFDRGAPRGGGGRRGGARVVIENLPEGIAWQDLKDEMSKVGSCRTDVKPNPSGRSATGFVTFDDARAAETAISRYNGAKFNGEAVRVHYE